MDEKDIQYIKEKRKKERMLPGDFSKKLKYDRLDDYEKEISLIKEGFFTFPEDVVGEQFKDRDFLVFYFDNEDDYLIIRHFFENRYSNHHSHPDLITEKLVKLVKAEIKNNE